MDEKQCGYCSNWEEGRPEGIEERAAIEVLISCGCGGTVKHAILRCSHCSSHYLSSYYDHKAFHSDDYEVKSISREDAEKIFREMKECKTPQKADCKCKIHKRIEFLPKELKGKPVHSETILD
jgi:hypothetical protein